jgi:hypothetical protein
LLLVIHCWWVAASCGPCFWYWPFRHRPFWHWQQQFHQPFQQVVEQEVAGIQRQLVDFRQLFGQYFEVFGCPPNDDGEEVALEVEVDPQAV